MTYMKEISYDELNLKLELHKKWLDRDKYGKRLILSNFDLSNMRIANADMRYCIAINTNFSGADLRNVRFDGAELSGSNLSYCNISGASFKGAKMDCVLKSGIDIGIGTTSELRNIYDIIEESDRRDSYNTDRELEDDDIADIEKIAIDRMIDKLEFSNPFEEDT